MKESEEALIRAARRENVFERVMENDLFKEDGSDIHRVGSVNKDYHKVNKKTYLFRIDYDSQIGYYSTRLSIDLRGNRELTLKCKLKCYEKPMKDPLGVSPSKGNQGTTRCKEKFLLTSV